MKCTGYTIIFLLLFIAGIARESPAQYYEDITEFLSAEENIFFHDALHHRWNTLLTEKGIPFREISNENTQASHLSASSMLALSEDAHVLLVIPKVPNPLLLSIFERVIDAFTDGTLQGVAILALGSPYDHLQQVTHVKKVISTFTPRAIVWLSEDLQAGTLRGENPHVIPPFHLAQAFFHSTRHTTKGDLPSVQLLGIMNSLISQAAEFEQALVELTIPTLLLSSSEAHTSPSLWIEHFISVVSTLSKSEALTLAPGRSNWQYQYIVIATLGNLIIQESILFLISFLALTLTAAYGIFYKKALTRHLERIVKHWHSIVWLIFLLSLSFFIGFLGVFFLSNVGGISEHVPLLIFRFLLPILSFSLLYTHITAMQIFRGASRYLSAFAILIFVFNIVIGTLLSLPMIFHFTMAFVFTFFFSLMKKVYTKLCWFLASLLIFIPELFIQNIPSSFIEFILFRPLAGTLFLSFTMLPFWCMVVRMDHLIPLRHKPLVKIINRITVGAVLVLSVFISIANMTTTPKLTVTEYINEYSRYLVLESPTPLGEIYFRLGDQQYLVESNYRRKTIILPKSEPFGVTRIRVQYREQLARIFLSAEFAAPAEELSIILTPQAGNMILHYADLPSSASYGTGVDQLQFIATYPSQTLQTSISLEAPSPVNILVQASYNELSEEISFPRTHIHITQQRKETLLSNYY